MVFRGDYYSTPTAAALSTNNNSSGDGDIGCKGIEGGGDTENMYHDVKDFNWLRSLVPSPNFTVVREEQPPLQQLEKEEVKVIDSVGDKDGGCSTYMIDEQKQRREEQSEESSDDEDEL